MSHTHTSLLAALTREQRMKLLQRSDGKGLLHLSVHWGCMVLVGAFIFMRIPYWWCFVPVMGILVISNFSLLHESIHKTPFKTPWLNSLTAHVSGLLVMIAPLWFRHFHTDHHRYTNNPEKDPELAVPKPSSWPQYIWHLSGLPVWWSQIRTLFTNASVSNRDPFVPDKDRKRVRLEAMGFVGFYGLVIGLSIHFQSLNAVWMWMAPVMFGQPFLRAYLLAEHGGCARVENMLENTRTTFTTFVVRFLMWNMPYHIEHHTFPAVPFHKLPDFHAELRDHLAVTEDGYLNFHRSYAKSFGVSNVT